jgi:hypothetical protein
LIGKLHFIKYWAWISIRYIPYLYSADLWNRNYFIRRCLDWAHREAAFYAFPS